jgi:hypothetical protein
MMTFSRVLGFCSLVVLCPTLMSAQTQGTAAWAGTVTKDSPGSFPLLTPSRIEYDLSWNNLVSAGSAKIRFQNAGDAWIARAEAGTTGLARSLWKYDCTMASILDAASLQSRYMEHSETDSAETISYRVGFEPKEVRTEAKITPKGGKTTEKLTRSPYGPMDDLQAAILYVRSQPLKTGQVITRVVQPFDRPYLATFTVQGRETRKVSGVSYPTIRLDVKIRKLHVTKLDLAPFKKMKTATIWVSDDAWRLPVEMHASIWVGFISATMVKREALTGADAIGTLPPSQVVRKR